MKQRKLKYGLQNGKLIHISQVESGLTCSCRCVGCNQPLVAKKGEKREEHFAHKSGESCQQATETALHYAAKEILNECREISLPPVFVEFNSYREKHKISCEKTFKIDSLRIEKGVEGLIPDLIASISGRELIIEVFVTHKVDDSKIKKYESLDFSAIEIDLSKAPRSMSMDSLKNLVVNSIENKKWIYNSRSKKEYDRIVSQTKYMTTEMRGFAFHVDFCPIKSRMWHGKPYANVIDDCLDCEHCIDVEPQDFVRCNGHIPSKEIYIPKACN